jgi:hypothetical protein
VITRFLGRTTQGCGRSATVPNFVPTTEPYRVLPRTRAPTRTATERCTCSIP